MNAQITRDPIVVQDLEKSVSSDSAGALITFCGNTRNHHEGRQVIALEYETYEEMALAKMKLLLDRVHELFPIENASICHRIGRVPIGETSVAIVVSSAHRGAAFDTCRYLIDQLKEEVPIWKKEFYEGGESWVSGQIPEIPA
ncbi:MAG: molybdenum cofactor biosynthesis protein MoaE [Planctomycetota bacterium]|jgi:molybdopterin synthase catalytic subunit|nr:molybdenum cofactor biosynthesis protein MoaE [Planctomycetota bacterium]